MKVIIPLIGKATDLRKVNSDTPARRERIRTEPGIVPAGGHVKTRKCITTFGRVKVAIITVGRWVNSLT